VIPISLVTFEHAIDNFQVDVPEFQPAMKVATWNATQICMAHYLKKPNPTVSDIPSEWLVDELPEGYPIPAAFVPVMPASYGTDSPQVQKYVIVPGNMLAAIMLMAGDLFENRESGVDSFGHGSNPMSDTVMNLLDVMTDPTMS
jgi:hypothetical protein